MTVHTPTHSQGCILFNSIHLLDLAVAHLTSNPFGNMPLVIEVSELGQIMNFNPLNGLAFVIIFGQIFDVRAIGLHHFVTVHANIHRRNTGMARPLRRGVAIHTGNLVLACVFFMTKRNRLNGRIPLIL